MKQETFCPCPYCNRRDNGCAGCEVQAYHVLAKAQGEGRMAVWPKELWAVKPNPRSNEWNSEPEEHIVHYIVHAYEPDTGRYFVNTDYFPGLKHRHWIKGKGLYESREAAEAAMREGGLQT